MFNLEQSIADWRQQMLAAGIQTPVPLAELEIHLREEIEQQMLSGLNAEKAFETAARKIGRVNALETEFAKMSGLDKSARWERQVAGFMAGVIMVLGAGLLLKSEMSLSWRLVGFADFAVFAMVILGRRYINKLFPVISNKRIRTAIGVAFGSLSMVGIIVFMNFVLPNFEFSEGQLTVVVLWSLTVMTALGAVWAGLEEAARKQIVISD